jgi:hypothetical protein
LRKLVLLAAMLAMALVAAAPALMSGAAFAQEKQAFSERRITSGANTPKIEVKNSGNNADLCPTAQQISNTGNVANEQGVVQYASKADDILFNPDTPTQIVITPSETAECTQTIEQAAAAG